MTKEEFKNISWKKGMRGKFTNRMVFGFITQNIESDIKAVDFQNNMIGIEWMEDDGYEIKWYRCEECELISQHTQN